MIDYLTVKQYLQGGMTSLRKELRMIGRLAPLSIVVKDLEDLMIEQGVLAYEAKKKDNDIVFPLFKRHLNTLLQHQSIIIQTRKQYIECLEFKGDGKLNGPDPVIEDVEELESTVEVRKSGESAIDYANRLARMSDVGKNRTLCRQANHRNFDKWGENYDTMSDSRLWDWQD